jgi:hypothetical protein
MGLAPQSIPAGGNNGRPRNEMVGDWFQPNARRARRCGTWPLKGLECDAAFAERFLRHEGIRMSGGSLRGENGRRIQFWPVSGRARQAFLTPMQTPAAEAALAARPASGGAVEFF